jgi:beta-galactosidase
MERITRRAFVQHAAQAAVAINAATQIFGAETGASTGRKAVARIQPHRGVPTLFINDEPTPAYIYFFPVPVKEDIADFAKAEVHLYSWGWGTIIAHCNDMGWIGPGKYDYGHFDETATTILEADPKGYLIPRIAVSAPEWWLEAHPNDRIKCEDGTDARRPQSSYDTSYLTSVASKAWLEDASEALRSFIEHVRSMPYGERVIGYQPTGGVNEWMYYWGEGAADFSVASLQHFREWLKSKYGDVSQLGGAWKSDHVDFENAAIPGQKERLKTDVNLLRNPAVSRQVSDYYQFFSEVTAEALIHLCRIGKEACRNESLLGAFYGYVMNDTGDYSDGKAALDWGHRALLRVLETPEVDYLCAPYQYTHRGPGGYDGPQSLPASVQLHGKLWMTECDTPTFVATPNAWNLQGRPVPTRAVSFAVMKRDFSQRLIRRVGMWWMDLMPRGGWYHHPDIVRFLARTRKILERSSQLDVRYKGEIAVIVDEETPFYVKPGPELLYPLVFLQDRLHFARIGTPYDLYLHNDLDHPNMPEYKLYIFLDTIYLTQQETKRIQEKVQKDNKVAVWLYAPGLINENGLHPRNMRDLTGIQLNLCKVEASNQKITQMYLTDFDHPITRGVPANTFFGATSEIGPFAFSEDPEALTLGRLLPGHASSGTPGELGEFPGFVVKRLPTWTSIFIGVPVVPSNILRNIAYFAGCHVYSADDDIVYANSHFVAIHTAKSGTKRIRLPKKTDVYDAFTESLIAENALEFTDELSQYGTKLYFLGDIRSISDKETRFDL